MGKTCRLQCVVKCQWGAQNESFTSLKKYTAFWSVKAFGISKIIVSKRRPTALLFLRCWRRCTRRCLTTTSIWRARCSNLTWWPLDTLAPKRTALRRLPWQLSLPWGAACRQLCQVGGTSDFFVSIALPYMASVLPFFLLTQVWPSCPAVRVRRRPHSTWTPWTSAACIGPGPSPSPSDEPCRPPLWRPGGARRRTARPARRSTSRELW